MIAIVGAGAMGAAMALHTAQRNPDTVLLATERDGAVVDAWHRGEAHPALSVPHPHVRCVVPEEWPQILAESELVIIAVSSDGFHDVVARVVPHLPGTATVVIATKGWHSGTLELPSVVASRLLDDASRVVSIGGPGLAAELAIGAPTALVCASADVTRAQAVARTIRGPSVGVVVTDDVVGVETSSAYKNVVAIGVGICEGFAERFVESAAAHTFANARAAVFAQGLLDMMRLAEATGGRADTLLGLAGAGDLYVTCLGGRNGRFGRLLGAGETAEQAQQVIGSTVEGVPNCVAALAIAERLGIDLPVARAVEAALAERLADEEGTQYVTRLLIAGLTPKANATRR